jgi:hypothetical protein
LVSAISPTPTRYFSLLVSHDFIHLQFTLNLLAGNHLTAASTGPLVPFYSICQNVNILQVFVSPLSIWLLPAPLIQMFLTTSCAHHPLRSNQSLHIQGYSQVHLLSYLCSWCFYVSS